MSESTESTTGSTFLDQQMTALRERIEEIKPLVDEYAKLDAALTALGGPLEDDAPATPATRRGRKRS